MIRLSLRECFLINADKLNHFYRVHTFSAHNRSDIQCISDRDLMLWQNFFALPVSLLHNSLKTELSAARSVDSDAAPNVYAHTGKQPPTHTTALIVWILFKSSVEAFKIFRRQNSEGFARFIWDRNLNGNHSLFATLFSSNLYIYSLRHFYAH